MNKYFIMFNPLTYNFMEIFNDNDKSPLRMISYLTNQDSKELSHDNYSDYLKFDHKKQRDSMVETFAIESYAALYIGNQVAELAPDLRVVHCDEKRRTLYDVIIREGTKPKAVFITTMSSNFPTAVALSIVLNHGKIPVVIGGIHVSTSPKDIDMFIRKYCPHPELVTQVIGAGDSNVVEEILNNLDNLSLKKEYLGYRIIEDGIWRPRINVDYLPSMHMDYLKRIPVFGKSLSKKMRIIPVAPFLGCPYSCNFCSISTLPKNQREFTIRSKNDFLDELEELQKNGSFDSRFFFFLPDNLLLGGTKLEAILDGIVERELAVNFAAQISVDIASSDTLLKKLRNAGATHFFIGFESLDIRNLEYLGKPILREIRRSGLEVPEFYSRQIKKILDHGISIHGAFIFGLPYDYFNSFSDNSARDVIQFCVENHIGLQPSSLSDLPGSRLFKESQDSGNWLYGKQGTMEYLLALCLTDLTETNRIPPESLGGSPLKVGYLTYESIRNAGSTKQAIKNAIYMFLKSYVHPTYRGKKSIKERLIDSSFAFTSQLIVSLYKDHGEKIANSHNGISGGFERLYAFEKDPKIKKDFKSYVENFMEDS